MSVCELIEKLKQELPIIFAGTMLDEFTGHGYKWRTLQNEKALGLVPDDVFLRSGNRKLLVVRDPFLKYWATKLKKGGE